MSEKNVIILNSKVRFSSSTPGVPTKSIPEHYSGRRVTALVDDVEKNFLISKEQLSLESTEEQIADLVATLDSEKN